MELVEESIGLCQAGRRSSCILGMPPESCESIGLCSSYTILLFPLFALTMGIMVALGREMFRPMKKVSDTLVLMVGGMILAALGCKVDLGLLSYSVRQWVHLDPPEVFFHVVLSPLIFQSAFNTDEYTFTKLLVPILTLAFPAVLVQVAIVAVFAMLVFRVGGWNWWVALMFGAMLSATDPISVTAAISSSGASEKLATLIEGESLLVRLRST